MSFDKRGYENKRYYDKREIVRMAKSVPCTDCGIRYPTPVMDFDHRDPSTKRFNLSRSLNRALKDVLAEIEKCDVVCANCHRLRTYVPGSPSGRGSLSYIQLQQSSIL